MDPRIALLIAMSRLHDDLDAAARERRARAVRRPPVVAANHLRRHRRRASRDSRPGSSVRPLRPM